jgi:N-methylhydantoinase A/oxoprolinase/acetone carboxylase beta subunit
MNSYSIGIDTGGTCTDGVLIHNQTLEVVHWAKEATTHHDLGIGVARVLKKLLASGLAPEKIHRLSVSTTLATNAVVEDKGARVGLLLFGPVRHFKLPVTANIFLRGGHKITGEEDEPLDLEALVDSIREIRGEVDSYALCSSMSMKNPTHELVAAEAISILDGKPVFCSHQVSEEAGMEARAATAALHAKLMPLMVGFLSSVQLSMLKVGLTCPVTIICGNGKGIGLDEAVQRAAVTLASGPAATARYACTAGKTRALVVDVGGTTTDVCMIEDGQVLLSAEGCRIGPWQTHVEAVDMYTAAGGGDSHVICGEDPQELGKKKVQLRKARVQPLAMTPDLMPPDLWLGCGLRSALILPLEDLDAQLLAQDELLSSLQSQGPATLEQLGQRTGISGIFLEKRLERLAYLQQIKMVGFTPSDALHVLGQLDIGKREQAEQGAKVLAALLHLDVEDFCRAVVAETERTIEGILLEYLGHRVWPQGQASALWATRDNPLFSLQAEVKIPLIGIGAASRCFLPAVAERLHTQVTFPEQYAVGNALGAALIGLDIP